MTVQSISKMLKNCASNYSMIFETIWILNKVEILWHSVKGLGFSKYYKNKIINSEATIYIKSIYLFHNKYIWRRQQKKYSSGYYKIYIYILTDTISCANKLKYA